MSDTKVYGLVTLVVGIFNYILDKSHPNIVGVARRNWVFSTNHVGTKRLAIGEIEAHGGKVQLFVAFARVFVFKTWFGVAKPFLRTCTSLELFSHYEHFKSKKSIKESTVQERQHTTSSTSMSQHQNFLNGELNT